MISSLLIAVGLAMDAFAVSVTSGATATHDRLKTALTAAPSEIIRVMAAAPAPK